MKINHFYNGCLDYSDCYRGCLDYSLIAIVGVLIILSIVGVLIILLEEAS